MASARARSETTVRPCAPLLDWSRVLANGKPLLADSPDAPASLRKSKAATPANPVHVWPKELAHVVAEHPGEIYFMHAKVAKPKKSRPPPRLAFARAHRPWPIAASRLAR